MSCAVCGCFEEEHEEGFFRPCTNCGSKECPDFEPKRREEEKPQRKQLITYDEAVPAKGQHTQPCSDCPFARTALPGWLAGETPEDWIRMAHGESKFECHTLIGAQCAGSAIYRSNVVKRCHDSSILRLPADREKVFATPIEFLKHHKSQMGAKKKAKKK